MNRLSNKGFTLIEVLLSIAMVTIIFLVVFNVVRGTMASTVTELDKISDTQVFKAAKTYILEANVSFNDNGYACIKVQELIDYGYINGINSSDKIVKVSRNNMTKVVENVEYDDSCK